MKKTIFIALALLVSAFYTPAQADSKQKKGNKQPTVLTTAIDSVSYAAGVFIGEQMKAHLLPQMNSSFEAWDDSIHTDTFLEALRSVVLNEPTLIPASEALPYFERQEKAARTQSETAYRQKNEQWLAENKQREGVQTTESGLQYKVITMGSGARPTSTDNVEVKYEGRMINGEIFDSSYKRTPQTNVFRANQVIKGWTEALQLMPVGSKFELYIPQELAYGARQAGSIKPYSTLIFVVELVDIKK